MIHSLVCVILPISLPPAYKPSFFDNPNFTVEEDKDATEENPDFTVEEDKDDDKEELLPDDDTKWWVAWETVSHLVLYFLEIAAVIAYAAGMYHYWSFEGKPYKRAFQDFWDELANWMHLSKLLWLFKFPLSWVWLALLSVGIFVVVLVLIIAFSDRKGHPKEKKYKLPEEGRCTSCCAGLKSSLSNCVKCCCKCCEKEKKIFTFNAEEEVCQLISREVEQEQTVEGTLSKKYRKEDIIVCGAAENIQMQPLLPAPSMRGTPKKLLDEGNNRGKERDEPRDAGGHSIDKPKDVVEETNRSCEGLSIHSHDAKAYTGPSAKTANEMMKDEGEKNNQTCEDQSKKGANEMEINAPISPIKNITDEKVSTENRLTKNDVNGGSANNERIDTSFDGTHQVAEEGNLQNQPKDLKNVSVQAKLSGQRKKFVKSAKK